MNWPPEHFARYRQQSGTFRRTGDGWYDPPCVSPVRFADAKELVHVARFGAAEYQAHIESVATTLEEVGKVPDYEAQIGRHLTDAEAEAFLRGESIQTDIS